MGSLGDNNGEIKRSEMKPNTDLSHADTQPFEFDSQFSLHPFSGDKADNEDGHELQYLQSTVPVDDNDVEDTALETQVVNFDEETQLLNFGGETQVLDDLDCFQNMETQLLDEFNEEVAVDSEGEATDGTEVLDDGDEVLREEDCGPSLGQEEKMESLEQCDASTDEQRSSGIHVSSTTPDVEAVLEPKPRSSRRFTSVRAASLRASALAARSAALQGINSESCSMQSSSGLNPGVVEKIKQAHDQGNNDEDSTSLRNSTARKLFAEDSSGENQEPICSSQNADAREDFLQFPECNSPSGGLSYINSQEPGELSQANALNFVERFVNENMVELDDEVDLGKSTGGKSKLISTAKGSNSLAKKTNERRTAGETKIFDWDDLLEDEGGGDIYCRRKEEFYGHGSSRAKKCFTHPQKSKARKIDESCNEDRRNAHDKILVLSDSKLLLGKSKDNDKTAEEARMHLKKNLFNESDEQLGSGSSRGQLEPSDANIGAHEVADIGFDTQMAAEAMEALFHGEGATDHNAHQDDQAVVNGSSRSSLQGNSWKRGFSGEPTVGKGVCSDVTQGTGESKKTIARKESSPLQQKYSKNVRKECDTEVLLPKMKKARSNTNKRQIAGAIDMDKMPSKNIKQRKAGGSLERSQLHGTRRSTRGSSIVKQRSEEVHTFNPIARRTRHSLIQQTAETQPSDCRKGRKHQKEVNSPKEHGIKSTDATLSAVPNDKRQLSKLGSNESGDCVNVKSSDNGHLHLELMARSNEDHAVSFPKKRRSCQRKLVDVAESDAVPKRSGSDKKSIGIHSITRRFTRSSTKTCPDSYQNSKGKLSHQMIDKQCPGEKELNCNSTEMNGRKISTSIIGPEPAKSASDGNQVAVSSPIAESLAVNITLDKSPKEKTKSSASVCTTPVNCSTPSNAASPVCMGEEYFKQSCKKNLSKSSLIKELRSLSTIEPEPISPSKDLRKRRDLANVRVLFSNHLDEDIVKQQKKILSRLGISEVSTILDATHFITDKFVRTRNMLEAIASGKPVVTHLWLESIGQVNIHIDEEAYILRDIRKEKELGFCLPASLARARKRPLLQGRRVLITPNTKPGKETISRLVIAVSGQAVERIGRSAMKDGKVPEDLLILSCEEDYEICVPFLEKGTAIYSSELLLNGIVTQRLEYERHRLFADHIKQTRSTIWLRKNNKFLPVTKHK